jgi:hypothetical protein
LGKSLGLVSCTKSKKRYRCAAREMYEASDLFRKGYGYAIKHYDYVAILSAKYGLLMPDDEIDPYDLTLLSMTVGQQKEWAERTHKQMKSKLPMNEISEVFFHSSLAYRKHLTELLDSDGIECVAPLEGLGFGKQKVWYLKAQEAEHHVRS